MGYTHYYAYDPDAGSFIDAWPRMVADARLIAGYVGKTLGLRLANGAGTGDPELSERRIWLNGPSAGDLGHETFRIDATPWRAGDERPAVRNEPSATRESGWVTERGFIAGFCKTARKPYDIAVTSILLRCRHLAPEAFVIASDGDWQHDWCHGATHRTASCDTDLAPVRLLGTLFAQVEAPGVSRLAPAVWHGLLLARRESQGFSRPATGEPSEI
ncbi:MAG TPA: hypothetical protein VHY83_11905 [Solirubrobacteraceae bacterium]|jgi:hypothetical protein|nr:hypothetical protein [Solirubrobacteraceae bacterium]